MTITWKTDIDDRQINRLLYAFHTENYSIMHDSNIRNANDVAHQVNFYNWYDDDDFVQNYD